MAGNPAPIRVAIHRETSRYDSPETREIYRGENQAVQSHFLGAQRRGALRSTLRQDGASATSEHVFKDVEEYQELVEFDTEEVTRPWFYAPYYSVLTDTQIAFVNAMVKNHIAFIEENKPTQAEATADLQSSVDAAGGDASIAGKAIRDIFYNGDTYTAFLPHITYTLNVSPNYTTPLVIADVGKVYSTVTLASQIPGLSAALFTASDILNTVTANPGQTLGWLKRARMGYASDGSAQYVQSYRFDAYATSRYTFV